MIQALENRGYVICSEHRSGSTLLCQLLASTGQLGQPGEFFSDPLFGFRIERDRSLLEKVVKEATSANGVFGLKVFSQQFDTTSKAGWAARLPNLRFVHLERRDLLGQAISLVQALQTGRFLASQPGRSEPRYDRRLIARHIARIAESHARWRSYFARNGIQPLWLIYEEVVADPQRAVSAIAAHIGLEGEITVDCSSVNVTVQRGAISDEWRARFIAEAGNLNYLDHRLGQGRIWLRRLARDAWHLKHRLTRQT